MAQLKDISSGQISGTGTLSCESKICGGVAIVADGTNTGTVVLRIGAAGGKKILEFSTKSPIPIIGPFDAGGTIYYSITGTGCTAQVFEWADERS